MLCFVAITLIDDAFNWSMMRLFDKPISTPTIDN